MKIAFLHYHLKPGGVTQVIDQQVQALSKHAEMLLLTGAAPESPVSVEYRVIPGIGYDTPEKRTGDHAPSPRQIADQIIREIHNKWSDGCDILHVHNPLLAKNQQFLKILSWLQLDGLRLLLQIHDFAEDGRPGSYYSGQAYPENCHYCVINGRDRDILLRSGLIREGLHFLPNMVDPFKPASENTIDQKFVLYPVRAIRRKNIGEAILLSCFFESGTKLAITLPPTSQPDWPPYNTWKGFVKTNDLPVIFEASRKYDFKALVQSAESMITTSITEGFGFAFVEPWTAGQFLAGRRLPKICRDFEKNGLCLDHLYDRLSVPLAAFAENRFFNKWTRCIQTNSRRFGVQLNHQTILKAYEDLTRDRTIDFGLLDEASQREVLSRTLSDTGIYQKIYRDNPALDYLTDVYGRDERISKNRTAVMANYSLPAYQKHLSAVYNNVQQTDVVQRIDKTRLAMEFLHPETFSLLKWIDNEPY